MILGSEEAAKRLCDELLWREQPEDLRIVKCSDLLRFANEKSIDRIIVADAEIEDGSDAARTLIDFKLRGVRIERAIESFERARQKIWLDGLSSTGLIFSEGFQPSKCYLGCKRVFDFVLSVAFLVVAAPLMALIAAAIKLDSTGSAIFKQERIGLRGRQFVLYKFRSMRQDAEQQGGPAWAKKGDDRVTPIGAFLRKCRLDELPQVFNVLRGDMSFVGPRPERPYFVELLKSNVPYYDLRHYSRPGISGWAQVMYPYGASVQDARQKLQYDLYYAKHMSFRFDLRILFKTIRVVLAGEGQ